MAANGISAASGLIGRWRTTGRVIAEDGTEAGAVEVQDSYEWFPGGAFILHRAEGRLAGAEVASLEILRHDPERGIVSRAYDNAGQTGDYDYQIDGRDLRIDGEKLRFAGRFSADGRVLEGEWFKVSTVLVDAPWMTVRLDRQD